MKVYTKVEAKKQEVGIFEQNGEINRFGAKILANGEQWIIDAKTGKPARREGYDCVLGPQGNYLWIKKGETIRSLDVPFPSIWDLKESLSKSGDKDDKQEIHI